MAKEGRDTNRVAIALITNNRDRILMGQRNDNSLYTIPGGHLKVKEDPYEGILRELKEETGLDAQEIQLIKMCKSGKLLIYLMKVRVNSDQEIDTSLDPDKECDDWIYIDPNDIIEELYVPIEDNIALLHWMNS